jgi:Fe2+ or Zn2+ uptake regulation protein
MDALPDDWRELPAYQRDILVACYHNGPLSGSDIFETVGECARRRGESKIYEQLEALTERGLLECEQIDGRTKAWDTSVQGHALLSRVSECWDGV